MCFPSSPLLFQARISPSLLKGIIFTLCRVPALLELRSSPGAHPEPWIRTIQGFIQENCGAGLEQGDQAHPSCIPGRIRMLESSVTPLGFPWSFGVKVVGGTTPRSPIWGIPASNFAFFTPSAATPAKNSLFLKFLSLLQPGPDLGLLGSLCACNKTALPFLPLEIIPSFLPPGLPRSQQLLLTQLCLSSWSRWNLGPLHGSSRGCSRLRVGPAHPNTALQGHRQVPHS